MDLLEYAQVFRLFADEVTAANMAPRLRALRVPDAAFVTPPAVTTLRLVGGPSAAEARPVAESLAELRRRGFLVSVGLPGIPECVVVAPPQPHPVQRGGVAWDGGVVGAARDLPPLDLSFVMGDGKPVGIVVDGGCAEAVLRGSNVFAPGVIAATRSFHAEEAAALLVPVSGPWGQAPPVLQRSYVSPEALATPGFVCIRGGAGVQTAVGRSALKEEGAKGLAVTVEALPRLAGAENKPLGGPMEGFGHPPFADMFASGPHATLFLQNFTSMIPAALLDPKPQHAVLDACAAPGGKTSHLLSRVRQHLRSMPAITESGLADGERLRQAGHRLVAYDRSAVRCKQLEGLLRSHHGDEVVDAIVRCVPRDVNKLAKAAAQPLQPSAPGDPTPAPIAGSFDRVLLDPSCTGFGLRPRVRSHPQPWREVQLTADYQRKLLRSAAVLLKPGGLLTYSTCTLSPLENEETVQWVLQHTDAFEVVLEGDGDCPPEAEAMRKGLRPSIVHREVVANELPAVSSCLPVCWTFAPRMPQEEACASDHHADDISRPVVDSVGFFVCLLRRTGIDLSCAARAPGAALAR